jgi:hypothetical protein
LSQGWCHGLDHTAGVGSTVGLNAGALGKQRVGPGLGPREGCWAAWCVGPGVPSGGVGQGLGKGWFQGRDHQVMYMKPEIGPLWNQVLLRAWPGCVGW